MPKPSGAWYNLSIYIFNPQPEKFFLVVTAKTKMFDCVVETRFIASDS